MSRFEAALRRAARELDLPPRAGAAVLLELSSDLEAVYEHHRGRGLSDEAAARRAEEQVLGSPEMLRRLGSLHRESWADGVSAGMASPSSLLLLALGVVPVMGMAAAVGVLILWPAAGPHAWALLGVAVLLMVMVAVELAHVGSGRRVRRSRIPRLLVVGSTAPAIGLLAVAQGADRVVQRLTEATAGGAAALEVARLGTAEGAAFIMGVLIGMFALIAVFVLLHREHRQADRDVRTLLSERPEAEGSRSTSHQPGGRVLPLVRRRAI